MFPTPIIISDDDTEIDDMVEPAPIIILSDDDSETDDIVPEVPSLAHPSPITISSSGTSGETLGDDSAEDHSSPPAPGLPISPMSPGLLDTISIMIDLQHEFMIGWEALYYQSMEIMVDSDDDPLMHYADLMLSDEPAYYQPMEPAYYPPMEPAFYQPMEPAYYQPMEPAHYQPMEPAYYQPMEPAHYQPMEPAYYQPMESAHYQPSYEIGEPSCFPAMETATVQPPYFHTTYETGGMSSCVPMETVTTKLPSYPTIYETGGPSCFPAMGASYVPGGSTSFGDPYAPQSYHYGRVAGHLTADCRRYDELSGIPYLHSAQPAGESSEWGYCPNCDMLLYIWRS
ncbi:hypothetical protein Bca52824_011320 [Brassica carinata]|uniref:Uncharacterized protein n=1 Tax=Brassica carinata TaxID=52824 RepID=A0A8X7WG23_BRACI|nr:hypothetical protein Bca52824_011320 [Brassica carinata]